jgi:endonuclease YncB( thermonuclease family)
MILALFLLAAASAQPVGETFTCTPTRVWDGDGPIWCAEGPRIRLAGVVTREMDGSCSPGHPCPSASAVQVRDALVKLIGQRVGVHSQGHILVRGSALTCRSEGCAGGGRTAAWCVSPRSGDLSCAMVRGGWALRWDRYWRNHRC